MASKESFALEKLYRGWVAEMAANPNADVDELRRLFDHWGDVTAEPGGVDYIEVDAGGVPAMWALPKQADKTKVLLCSHGGGYVVGSMYTHRKLFGHLAKAVGCRALIVDYRRAPESPLPGPVNDMVTAYRWLLESQRCTPGDIAFTGDSSGGALAVTPAHAPYLAGMPDAYGDHEGERVIYGQRLLQAVGDPLLGWTTIEGRPFYVRQMKNMKGDIPVAGLTGQPLIYFSWAYGALLARAHARTGDAAAIAGYCGRDRQCDLREALADWALAYGDQNEADFAAFPLITGRDRADGRRNVEHLVVKREIARRQNVGTQRVLTRPGRGPQSGGGFEQLFRRLLARPVIFKREFQFAARADARETERCDGNGHV